MRCQIGDDSKSTENWVKSYIKHPQTQKPEVISPKLLHPRHVGWKYWPIGGVGVGGGGKALWLQSLLISAANWVFGEGNSVRCPHDTLVQWLSSHYIIMYLVYLYCHLPHWIKLNWPNSVFCRVFRLWRPHFWCARKWIHPSAGSLFSASSTNLGVGNNSSCWV